MYRTFYVCKLNWNERRLSNIKLWIYCFFVKKEKPKVIKYGKVFDGKKLSLSMSFAFVPYYRSDRSELNQRCFCVKIRKIYHHFCIRIVHIFGSMNVCADSQTEGIFTSIYFLKFIISPMFVQIAHTNEKKLNNTFNITCIPCIII